MSIKLQLPKVTELRPRIAVIGVGGAGGNAVNNMIASGLSGVEFVVANTDAQALAASSAEHRIQLGVHLTEGLGAGSKPEIGQAAAEEALDEIRAQVAGVHMVFIAAGMGGGTGTGAAAVIARVAKEAGALVVAVVTKPFQFEGSRRMRMAEAGIEELRRHVDTIIVIPNQNLFRVATERTTFAEAFVLADQVLYSGIACIVDLIVKEGLINLDFADVRTVLAGMGSAMMGTGEASGERRAIVAAEEAIANPLLDDVSLKGAKGLLLSIIGGRNLTLYEVDEAASRVRQEVDPEANIIVGATFDDSLEDRVRVSIVASGMSGPALAQRPAAAATTTQMAGPQPPAAPARPVERAPAAVAAPAGHRGQSPVREPSPLVEPTVPEAEELARALDDVYRGDTAPAAAPTWESPDGVVIEDLPLAPPAPPSGPMPPPLPPAVRRADGAPAATFTPQPPAEIRRPPRRMPNLEDFPAVGQREYQAKAPVSHNGMQPPPRVYGEAEPARRRPGFFERLTGWGQRDLAAPAADDRAYQQAGRHGSSPPPTTPPTGRPAPPTPALPSDDAAMHKDVDLPGFFDRRRQRGHDR